MKDTEKRKMCCPKCKGTSGYRNRSWNQLYFDFTWEGEQIEGFVGDVCRCEQLNECLDCGSKFRTTTLENKRRL